jgi:hypothetical protein
MVEIRMDTLEQHEQTLERGLQRRDDSTHCDEIIDILRDWRANDAYSRSPAVQQKIAELLEKYQHGPFRPES